MSAGPAWAEQTAKVPPAVGNDDERQGDWVFGERKHHIRPQAVSLCATLFTDRLSGGAWYAVALAHDGLLSGLNDAVFLELGADYMNLFRNDLSGLWMGLGPRWDWYLTRALQVFAAVKLGLFATLSAPPGRRPAYFNGGLSLGGELRLNDRTRLRLEGGAPFGVRIGVTLVL